MARPDPIPFNTPLNREPRGRRMDMNNLPRVSPPAFFIVLVIALVLTFIAICKDNAVNGEIIMNNRNSYHNKTD